MYDQRIESATPGTGTYIGETKATLPNLSAKCMQFDERVASLFQAVHELEGITTRLLGAELKDAIKGSQMEPGSVPKPVPPVDLQFASSLERLASLEGWLRTVISKLDRGI